MASGSRVREQLDRAVEAQQRAHHHAVQQAREARRLRARVEAAQATDTPPVPDLAPEGMPGVPPGVDPLAGL